jgi:hypothetical protein
MATGAVDGGRRTVGWQRRLQDGRLDIGFARRWVRKAVGKVVVH